MQAAQKKVEFMMSKMDPVSKDQTNWGAVRKTVAGVYTSVNRDMTEEKQICEKKRELLWLNLTSYAFKSLKTRTFLGLIKY